MCRKEIRSVEYTQNKTDAFLESVWNSCQISGGAQTQCYSAIWGLFVAVEAECKILLWELIVELHIP